MEIAKNVQKLDKLKNVAIFRTTLCVTESVDVCQNAYLIYNVKIQQNLVVTGVLEDAYHALIQLNAVILWENLNAKLVPVLVSKPRAVLCKHNKWYHTPTTSTYLSITSQLQC